jgi:hypothetical protein
MFAGSMMMPDPIMLTVTSVVRPIRLIFLLGSVIANSLSRLAGWLRMFWLGRVGVPLLPRHPLGLQRVAEVVGRHDLHAELVENVLDIGVQQAEEEGAWPGLRWNGLGH